MPLKLFLTFDTESNRPGNYITCDHVPGAPGVYWIMDELERYEQCGVFFVNVYEHTRYADGWMAGLLRDIQGRGHEVALHCHPNPALEFYQKPLTQYDVDGQARILRYGADFIEAAIGERPTAFRAGALHLNGDTFRALERAEIPIDSSLLFSRDRKSAELAPDTFRSVNRSAIYGAVSEFPVTMIDRRGPGRQGQWARLDPNVTPDQQALTATVEQMIAAGCGHAVLIAHSFSFVLCTYDSAAALPGTKVFKKAKQKYVAGTDERLREVFGGFLSFLQANRDRVESARFRDLPPGGPAQVSTGRDYVPQVADNGLPSWPTMEDYRKIGDQGVDPARGDSRTSPKTVVLHVGTWKTGSKALQKFWEINREALAERGILYPLNRKAPYMVGGNRSYQSRIATAGAEQRTAGLRALAQEIRASDCDICLISHENICNLPTAQLLEFVAQLSGCTFKVVLYLRRQDAYAESLYNQHVKAGNAFAGSFDEHLSTYRARYDYRQMVERLGTVFDLDNVIVRPYERGQFDEGTIFADFMHHAMGMAIDATLTIPDKDRNSRLLRDALELKRLVNGLGADPAGVLQFGRDLIDYCEQVDPQIRQAFQEHGFLSPAERGRIVEMFADGNAWIARERLGRGDGVLFREPLPDQAGWTPYPGLTGERAVEIGFQVYRSLLAELQRREAEVERLKAKRRRPATAPREEAPKPGLRRVAKRFWKRQIARGRGLASRVWPGNGPNAGATR